MQCADGSVLVEDDIAAQPIVLEAQATAFTVPRTLDSIRGHAGFGTVLHPGHAVAVRIQERHSRPGREDDHQVGCNRLVVFISVDDLEGLGEGQEMRTWIRSGDLAHSAEVVAVEDVAGDMPPEKPWLGLGDLRRNLREVGIRILLGEVLVPAPRCAGARVKPHRFQCIASAARARDTLNTALSGSC